MRTDKEKSKMPRGTNYLQHTAYLCPVDREICVGSEGTTGGNEGRGATKGNPISLHTAIAWRGENPLTLDGILSLALNKNRECLKGGWGQRMNRPGAYNRPLLQFGTEMIR
ncbi:hypothetical protein AVEN_128249-1 [Araneus ventricosus]|uniref:Uncharacterized protein n=1 Tax=Araneus ventricosus TaxID=182803 RepID=A0A4Y2A144_ARAVE|nr:hypothetical protein AVEN_128249-1 [Araneus ventricosus]